MERRWRSLVTLRGCVHRQSFELLRIAQWKPAVAVYNRVDAQSPGRRATQRMSDLAAPLGRQEARTFGLMSGDESRGNATLPVLAFAIDFEADLYALRPIRSIAGNCNWHSAV